MRYLLVIGFGLIAGIIISGGIFAFMVMIGVVPRLIQRTKTAQHILLYENMVMLGGALSGLSLLSDYFVTGFEWAEVIVGLSYGAYLGCLAVALAEVLNVLPILCRRLKVAKEMPWLMLVLALGKAMGTLIYYFVPGFLEFH